MPEPTMLEEQATVDIEQEIVDGVVIDPTEIQPDPFEGRVLSALEAEAELQARVAAEAANADAEGKPDPTTPGTEGNLAVDGVAPVVAQPNGTEGAPVVPDPAATTNAPPEPEKKPFAFRVDGTPVDVPNTFVVDGEIRGLTEETFHKFLRPKYMGDRASWDRQKAQYERQIAALADENRPEIQRAKAIVDRFVSLLEMDDDARDEEILKLKRELPVVMAEADAEAARGEATAYKAEVQRTQQTERISASLPVLREELVAYVKNAVNHEMIRDAGLDAEEMAQALVKQFGIAGLYQAMQGGPIKTAAGEFDVLVPRVDEFLIHNANLVRRERATVGTAQSKIAELEARVKAAEEAAKVAKSNATVLAKDAPNAPPPVVPVAGGAATGEKVPAWRDPSKPFEERKAAFDAYMKKTYGASV